MSKTDINDEDDVLLSQLTEDEIAELNNIIDPDNVLLPASERMPDHTVKKSTGTYNRDNLLTHLKKEAKESKVGEDYVPFIPKTKPAVTVTDAVEDKKKTVLTTEFDDILNDLDEADIAELASELGIHSAINQAQSRGDMKTPNQARASPMMRHKMMDLNLEMPKESVIFEAITSLEENDPSFTELNLNNHPMVTSQHIDQLLAALKNNSYVEIVSLANVKMADKHTQALAEVIRENDVIRTLNIESNRLNVPGIKCITDALKHNETIREIRISNQLAGFGHRTENDIAKMLQHNTTILKFGYAFQSNGPRFEAERYLMRNTEKERQKRQNLAVY